MATSFTTTLSAEQAQKLRTILSSTAGFELTSREYTDWCYSKKGVAVAHYPKKGKLLIQGAGTDEFIEFVLEPKVLFTQSLSLEKNSEKFSAPAANSARIDDSAHFGVDESGKGDYFGPLVIAGVYSEGEGARALHRIGCCDSKAIGSEKKIMELEAKILARTDIVSEVVCIGPARYNELYAEMSNLNRLLAWGHARVIASLHAKVPSCPRALSDQFANEWVLKRALGARKIPVKLEQRPRAEADIAVAAASILARARFVRWMRAAAKAAETDLPLGCAPHVLKAAKAFVRKHGMERLPDVAKLHFKLTAKLGG